MGLLVGAYLLITLDQILNLLLLPLLLLLLFGILLLALPILTGCLDKAIVWQCRRRWLPGLPALDFSFWEPTSDSALEA